jgi:membrane protease YdiL (CAAX protease family)
LLAGSLLFSLAHPLTLGYMTFAGLFGVYPGLLYLATGNLLAPATAHFAYDFLALVYLTRRRGR